MKFTLTINCDNDAFTGQPEDEIARILEELAAKVRRGTPYDYYMNLYDANGLKVGRYCLDKEY